MTVAGAMGLCVLIAVCVEVIRAIRIRAAWRRAFRCRRCNGYGKYEVLTRCGTVGETDTLDCEACDGTGSTPAAPNGTGET